MADKIKRNKRQKDVDDGEEKPTKEEYAVAKYLRFSLPERDGKLHGMDVKCFMGNAAVGMLMESQWSASKNKTDAIFTSRASCVNYMVRLLEKGLFHRAEKEKRKKEKEKESKSKKKKIDKETEKEDSANPAEDLRERKGKKVKKSKKEAEVKSDETEKKESEEKKDTKEEKKKKSKLLKLVMPEKQFFEDGEEVFVWIYEPTNLKNLMIGFLMVLGAISLCLFPLWPEEIRIGVWYLSMGCLGFIGFILALVVIRLILFCCIWVLTFGIHHFWFLPNLTEDVGFFESFVPLYFHERWDSGLTEENKKETSKNKKKKDGEPDKNESKEKSKDKDDSDEFEVIKKEEYDDSDKAQDGDDNDNDVEEDDEESNINDNGDSEEDTEPKKSK